MTRPTYSELEQKIRQMETEIHFLRISKPDAVDAPPTPRHWQATFDAMGVSICILSPDWTVIQCNKATNEMLGSATEGIVGHKCYELVHGTPEPHKNCPVHTMLHDRRRAVETIQVGDKWLEVSADPITDETGEILAIVHVISDITRLYQIEQKFRSLMALLPQTVFETTEDGRLTLMNNSGLNIFGYNARDLDSGLAVADLVAPEDRPEVSRMMTTILNGTPFDGGQRVVALGKNKHRFPALVYASLTTSEEGSVGVHGIIVDVSEQEKLAGERDQLEKQYIQAQKMEAIGQLAGGVAHDLNNMLSPIVGYGEMLLEAMPEKSQHHQSVGQIYSAGLRARDMVQQLLAFSRKQALEMKPIDMNSLLADFKGLLARILREDITLIFHPSDTPVHILADGGQIEQVILNLAVNAQDAMPEGGKVTITVDDRRIDERDVAVFQVPEPGHYGVLTFTDTGCGMDRETRNKIFDPFFTTKSRGKGTGLGLATVYGIVKQHNGAIRVSSEAGRGTMFELYFPCANTGPEKAVPQPILKENLHGTERILIAEDNDMVRRMVENILKKYGYQTIAVSSGRHCRHILDQAPKLDLLLTDVILQDTNGKALYHEVRVLHPTIKVIYMSGYTGDIIGPHGVLDKGIAFIQKPFSQQDLLNKVREQLDGVL